MSPEHIHRYVIEHVSGVPPAKTEANRLLLYGFVISASAAFVSIVATTSLSNNLELAGALLLAGIPFAALLQRLTMRIPLSREQLRLKRFLIGRKGYIAPKDHVLHAHADLFAAACNLVCQEPFLTPQAGAAAWHSYGPVIGLPGVAAYTGWFGDSAKPLIFLYGDQKALAKIATDIWDLGHIRKIAELDKDTLLHTSAGWKRQQLIPVALASAPLPEHADPGRIHLADIDGHATLLGAVGLEGSRGLEASFPISPPQAITTAAQVSLVTSVALASAVWLAVLGEWLFGWPVFLAASHVLVFKLAIEPLVFLTFSWDRATKPNKRHWPEITNSIWNGALIGSLAFGSYIGYGFLLGTTNLVIGNSLQRAAAAVAVLTLGLGLLLQLLLSRRGRSSFMEHNPLFALALSSALLLVLLLAYATGPIVITGLSLAIGTVAFYGCLRELHTYAEKHHGRAHILDLLKSS